MHRRAGRPERDDAGLVQSDERHEEPDANGEAVAQIDRHGVEQPLADLRQREQDEEYARDEHRAQRLLPGKMQLHDNSEREERVLAHVRRYGERTVRVEAHQHRPEDGGRDGRDHRGVARQSGRRHDRRIHHDDVAHRHERRQPGHGFLSVAGAVLLEAEVARDRVHSIRVGPE